MRELRIVGDAIWKPQISFSFDLNIFISVQSRNARKMNKSLLNTKIYTVYNTYIRLLMESMSK